MGIYITIITNDLKHFKYEYLNKISNLFVNLYLCQSQFLNNKFQNLLIWLNGCIFYEY